jgi:hypothetical protein
VADGLRRLADGGAVRVRVHPSDPARSALVTSDADDGPCRFAAAISGRS